MIEHHANETPYPSGVLIGGLYARLGNADAAMKYLERAYEERDRLIVGLQVDPAFVGMRNDPRFQELLRRMRFPD